MFQELLGGLRNRITVWGTRVVAGGNRPELLNGAAFAEGESDLHQALQVQAAELAQTTAALEIEKRRLQLVLEGTRLGLWEWNVLTGQTAFDERWAEIIGYTPTELAALDMEQLATCHPDDEYRCSEGIQALLAGEAEYYDVEVRMRHRDGRWLWIRDRGSIVERTASGEPLRMAGTHEDVTELALAREALRQERGRLRATIDGQMDAAVLLDPDRNSQRQTLDFALVEANARACEELGVDYGTLIGTPLSAVAPEPLLSVWLRVLDDVVRTGEPLAVDDLPDPRRPGCFVDVRAVRVGTGVSVTWRDVTERRTAAARLAAAEQHFRLLADNAQDVILLLTTDGEISWVSPSVTSTLGYLPGEFVGPVADMPVHADDTDALLRAVRDTAESGRTMRLRVRLGRSTGEYRWISATLGRASDAAGATVGLIGSLQDIHEQVLAEQAVVAARRRFTTMFRQHDAVMLLVEPESGRIVDANVAAEQFYGYSREQMQSLSMAEIAQLPAAQVLTMARQALAGESNANIVSHSLADGRARVVEVHSSPIEDGDQVLLFSIVRDVTEDLAARQGLAKSEAQFRLISENSMDVVLHSRAGVVEWVSTSLTPMLGWEAQDWIGRPLADLMPATEFSRLQEDLDRVATLGTSVNRFQIRAKGEVLHWIETHSRIFTDEWGFADGVVTSFRTIDSEVAAEQELRRRAELDNLTGILNRTEGLHRLERVLRDAERAASQLAVLFCDVDNFKGVNDSLGHGAGDELLRQVVDRITSVLGVDHLVARVGGDEFLVVLAGVPDMTSAFDLADQMRRRVAEPMQISGHQVAVTLSVGSTLAVPGEDVEDVVQRADAAMYEAKKSGRNRVVAAETGSHES